MFRITKAEEQAMRLTMRLASVGQQLTLSELAEAENLPEPTVAKLLGLLRKGGVTEAVRGRHGGYVLAGSPSQISSGQVIRCVSNDGPESIPCGNQGENACSRNSDCGLRPVWQHLENRLSEVLDNTSIADLLARESVSAAHLKDLWPLSGD